MTRGKPEKKAKIYPINEKYRIECDRYNYMLQSKTGKKWITLGYYSRISSLMARFYEFEIKENIDDLSYVAKLKRDLVEQMKQYDDLPRI